MEVIELFRLQVEKFDSGISFPDKIRSGSQGCVVAMVCENGEKIASKIINYSNRTNVNKAITDFEREYRSLQVLNHPSIVKFLNFEHHPATKQAFLQMEWAGSELAQSPGGAVDLADIIEHRQRRDGQSTPDYLPESFIWHVLFHIGAALALCHHGIELHRKTVPEEVDSRAVLSRLFGQSSDRLRSLASKHPTIRWTSERITFSARRFHEPIIHRDIKPRNILLSDPPREPSTQIWRLDGDISLEDANVLRIYPVVLLGDFGLSAPLRDARTRGIGTIGYAAPEVPLEPNRPGSGPFEWKTSCDIYSLGATIRHLMALQSPPEYAVSSTAWPPFPSAYSEQLKQLVSRCHSDPSQRPTAIEVLDACIWQHRWDQTYIGPYGVPITANFTAAMTRSWSECVQAMAPVENLHRPSSMQLRTAEGFGFQTVDVLTLDRQTEASSLAMLIAGAYHYQLFHPKAKYSLPPRNNQFVNRPRLLQELRSRLNEETKDQVTIVLHGLGGIGKTQIALDLAHQLRDTDPGLSIFWVLGDNSSAFEESYRRLALVCGIPSGYGGDASFLGRVKRWLESPTARRWLMIIDNVDDVHSFYRDQTGGDTPPGRYIPCCAHGSLLFTTRDASLQTKIRPRPFTRPVPPLTPEEAKDLLLRITSDTKFTLGHDATISPLSAGGFAAEITKALGHLPLAITQAASYMNMLDVSAPEYLASFRAASQRLLRVQFPDTQRQRGMESIVSTLQITFDQLQQRSGSAMEVLALISFIHQDNIPVSLLRSAFPDKLEFIEALSSLREFSFINANENAMTYSVHPLIQSATLALLESRGTREEHALRIWQLLDQNIPHTSSKDWEAALDLLPHAHSALSKTSNVKADPLMRARFIMKITPYWTKLGRFASAEEIAREAIELLGKDHPDVADAYISLGYALLARGKYMETSTLASQVSDSERAHGLESKRLADALGLQGLVMQGQGNYSLAVEVHEREVSIRESADPSSLISWTSKMNLAHALERKGDYRLAEKYYRSTLEGRAAHFGADHPDTIACMSDLAVTLQHQSRNSEALELLEQAVEVFAKTLSESSPQALKASVRLASVKMDLDQIKEAEELYASTLSKMENVFGKEHPDTIECLSRLGDVYFVEGESFQAESTFQMAIETSTTNLGAEHPLTLSIMKSAARNHQLQQRLAEAESMYNSILTSRRNVLGIDHPDTISSVSDLASVLYDWGRLDDAEAMYQQALRDMEKVLGSEHSSTLNTINDLGNLYRAQGQLSDAGVMYERALQGYQKALGPEHTSTLQTVNNLGNLYVDQGRLSDAVPMYERALHGKEKMLGPEHPSALNTINNLGNLYVDQGRLSDAEAIYERALHGYQKALGPEHPSTLQTVNNLGNLYADQGRLDDAEAMYQQALHGIEKALGPEHPSTLQTVNNLGNLYADQGQLDKAEAIYKRVLHGYQKALGPEHRSTLQTVNNLGNLYADQGRFDDAEAMYQQALHGIEKALGPEHPSTLNTVNNLGSLYKDQGRLNKAEVMYERALQGYEKALGPEHPSTLQTVINLDNLSTLRVGTTNAGETIEARGNARIHLGNRFGGRSIFDD